MLGDVRNALEASTKDGELSLSAETSGCKSLEPLLAAISNHASIDLTHVELSASDSPLTLSGRGRFWKIDNAVVQAEFSETGGIVSVTLHAAVPDGWTLHDSLPELPPTPGLDESLLYALGITGAEFTLRAHGKGAEPVMAMTAKAQAKDTPGTLQPLLPQGEFGVSGVVQPSGDTPGLTLRTTAATMPGADTVHVSNIVTTVTTALDTSGQDESSLAFGARLALGSMIEADVTGALPMFAGMPISLSADMTGGPQIDSVAKLLANFSNDLAAQVAAWPAFEALAVGAIAVDIDPLDRTIPRVSIEIEKTGASWPIGPTEAPLLTIETFRIHLVVYEPLDNERRALSASVNGTTALLGSQFEVGVSFPGAILQIANAGPPLRFSRLLTDNPLLPTAFPSAQLPDVGDLTLKTLEIHLDLGFGNVFFKGALDGKLSFAVPGCTSKVEIEDAEVTLSAQLDAPARTSVGFRGNATVGGISGDIKLVVALDSVRFSAEIENVDLVALIEAQLGTTAKLPKIQLERAYVSAVGDNVSLGARLSTDVSSQVGKARLAADSIWANVIAGGSEIRVELGGSASIGRTQMAVDCELDSEALTLSGSVPQFNLAWLIADTLGIENGVPALTLDNIHFDVSTAGTASFSAENLTLDFRTIADALGARLPAGTPSPVLSVLDASIGGQDSHLRLHCDDSLAFVGSFHASNFDFLLQHAAAKGLSVSLAFDVGGSTELARGCQLSLALSLAASTAGDFVAAGNAKLSLFGASVDLDASLKADGDDTALELKMKASAVEVGVPGVLSLTVRTLALSMTKSGGKFDFDLTGTGQLAIAGLAPVDATLRFDRGDGATTVVLEAATDPLALPALEFPAGPTPPTAQITLRHLRLAYAAATEGSAAESAGLSLTADANVTLTHFAPVDSVIGTEFTGTLTANASGVALECVIPGELRRKPWPQISVKVSDDREVKLPVPTLEMSQLVLRIDKAGPEFAAEWQVHVPQGVNNLIGLDLFSPKFGVRLEIGKAISLWPTGNPNWPFRDLETVTINDKEWIQLGKALVEVPHFAFAGGVWAVTDLAVSGLRDCGIPLVPIRTLLKSLFASSKAVCVVIDQMPDSIPLSNMDIGADNFSSEIPKLIGRNAVATIDRALPGKVTLAGALKEIAAGLKKLPDDFRQYLQIDIPNGASLDIGITPSGGASIAFRVDPNHPLKVLLPYVGTLPGLMGLTIRELKLGEAVAGSMLTYGFDGHIDQFDFVTLLAAVSNPNGGTAYRHRYTLSKVFAVGPTALPIPIPLLFGELALDHVDWLGFELHTHWSFGPEKAFGLLDLINLIVTLVPFFGKSGYFLHQPDHWPGSLALPLHIGQNTIQLPAFLGGGDPIGLNGKGLDYDASVSISYLLDSLKDLNPAFAIQAIPLRTKAENGAWIWVRVNQLKSHITFGPIELSAGAAWCIVTEEEFKSPAIQHDAIADGKLTPAMLEGAVHSLPRGAAFSDCGFFIFLLGGWDLKSIAGMSCQFGISYTQDQGFQTGIRLSAELGGALTLTIGGTIQISQSKQHIDGQAMLLWTGGGKPADLLGFKGNIDIVSDPEKQLTFDVTLTMGLMKVGGGMSVAASGVTLVGRLTWTSFTQNDDEDGQAKVRFDSAGVTASAKGRFSELDVQVTACLPQLTATLAIEVTPALATAVQAKIVQIAQAAADDTIVALYQEISQTLSLIGTYEGDVKGLIETGVPKICNTIESTIEREIHRYINDKTKGLPSFMKKAARKSASWFAMRQARPYLDAVDKLKNAAKHGKSAVQSAARELIAMGRKKVFGITPLGDEQAKQLSHLVDMIGKLDETTKISGAKQAEFAAKSLAQQILAEVKASTREKIADAIPRIESFEATGIHLDKPVGNQFRARLQFSKGKAVEIDVYPGDVATTANSVAAAIKRI